MNAEKCFWVSWLAMSGTLAAYCAWTYFTGLSGYWAGNILVGTGLGIGLVHNLGQVVNYSRKNNITGRLKAFYLTGITFLTLSAAFMPLYALSPILQ